ncbi:MAG: nucleoside triphosphate pyrophosphohydrolase [Verrucomicrobiota bacterium]
MRHAPPSPDLPPIDRLREIMHLLRAPGGCPWDAEQTHESLLRHLIEEAYEVAEAVRGGDRDEIVDELGDLLLQPIFHAEIASESGAFTFDDVATAICEKLIRRHPHVFSNSEAPDADAVLSQWEQIKRTEKGVEGESDSSAEPYLTHANEGLPALLAAQKLQKKVARVGFDWGSPEPVVEKIREELDEVVEALGAGNPEAIGEEIGDLLFAVVNLARQTGGEAELLLDQANRKFVERFGAVERILQTRGQSLSEASLDEMDSAWEEAKSVPGGA